MATILVEPTTPLAPSAVQAGRRFVAALWAHAQTRLELLTLELAEERDRTVHALVSAGLLLILSGLALAFGGIGLLVAMWDTPYRVPLAIGLPFAFALGGFFAWLRMKHQIGRASTLFAHSLAELRRDVESLRPGP